MQKRYTQKITIGKANPESKSGKRSTPSEEKSTQSDEEGRDHSISPSQGGFLIENSNMCTRAM